MTHNIVGRMNAESSNPGRIVKSGPYRTSFPLSGVVCAIWCGPFSFLPSPLSHQPTSLHTRTHPFPAELHVSQLSLLTCSYRCRESSACCRANREGFQVLLPQARTYRQGLVV